MTSIHFQITAQQVLIENHDFSQPGAGRQTGWKNVPGWNCDGDAVQSGVQQDSTSGEWTAYLHRTDPSVWNLSSHRLQTSDEIMLVFKARNIEEGRTLRASLFYSCNNSRVTVATCICRVSRTRDAMKPFTLKFSAASRPDVVGHKLGVEFQTINGGTISIGEVILVNYPRIVACNPYPMDRTQNMPSTATLRWLTPQGVTEPVYNVYLGMDPDSLVPVSREQSAQTYTPDLSPGAEYYWRVDIVSRGVVSHGDIWRFSVLNAAESVFFVDSAGGNDANSGRTPDQAWASLHKINNTTFHPGDRILLKAGTGYLGQLKPIGSGSAEKPIIIDSYGSGGKPCIDAQGKFHSALSLNNQDYWEINNLEIVNKGDERAASRRGVVVRVKSRYGVMRHIHLKGLYIHDINGSLVKAEGGGSGIFFRARGEDARFDDILVENCYLVRCDRNGIDAWGDCIQPWKNWNPSTNVIWRNNLLEDIGGDCVLPIGFEGALIENNVIRGGRTRAQDQAAGMWPWACKNTIFQFNEVSGMLGTRDGQAFDCDYECIGTIFQYNYSHDNDGGFMLVTGNGATEVGARDSIIRYNISQNDGSNARIIHLSGNAMNTRIYNNVIYSELNNFMILIGNWNGWPSGTQFVNNIFYVMGKADYDLGQGPDSFFDSNVFFGNHLVFPSDENAMADNPLLIAPGDGGDTRNEVKGYMLSPGSPCIDAGKDVEDIGQRDFWGNPVPDSENQLIDRGVHEASY